MLTDSRNSKFSLSRRLLRASAARRAARRGERKQQRLSLARVGMRGKAVGLTSILD